VQDKDNANLLVVGNNGGVYASLDGGKRWSPLQANMPAVPVHDLVIHPREGDVVVGTYGRGLWVANIWPLKELTPENMDKKSHFIAPQVTARPREGAFGNYRWYGDSYP